MIDRMTKYSFILLSGDEEKFLSDLQESGVVDITRSSVPVNEHTAALFSKAQEKSEEISRIETGRDPVLTGLDRRIAENEKKAADVQVWGSWDRARLDALGLPLHFYKASPKAWDPSWKERWAIQEVAADKKNIRFVVVGDNEGFPLKETPAPAMNLPEIEAQTASLKAEREAHATALEGRKKDLPALKANLAKVRSELSRALAGAAGEKAAEDKLTVFVGFVPDDEVPAFDKALPGLDAFAMKEEATVEDQPPIRLRNNRFVKMFEVLTDMYGRPVYNEFDPTPYLSIFFLLFFAMCMGDAGYGIALVAIGLLLRKSEGMKDLSPLVMTLGAATFVIGIVMHTFFGYDISTAAWVPGFLKKCMVTGNIAGFDANMVLSIIIGVVHLCLAFCLKAVYATKKNGFLRSLGTWGWTLLIVGGVIVGAVSLTGALSSQVTKWIVIGLGVISAAGIFLFSDISRNPLKNIGPGLWETYNTATGLLGDVLSYLRLYALGLAGGMLGKAFNDIAAMTLGDGGFGIGWIFFALIFVIGHTLNLAMCCLGAFVHPLRLNFLEFFKNSGYEGKGRIYRPITNK